MKAHLRILSAVLLSLLCLNYAVPVMASEEVPEAVADRFEGISEEEYSKVSWHENNLAAAVSKYPDKVASLSEHNGRNCVKMVNYSHKFSNFSAAGQAYSTNYNCAIKLNKGEYEANDLAYCVISYSSVSDKPYTLWLWCPNLHEDGRRAEKIVGVQSGKTGWSDSEVITVTAGLKNRITSSGEVVITADAISNNTEIYIGDIIFFETKEGAEKYLTNRTSQKLDTVSDGLDAQLKLLMLLVGRDVRSNEKTLSGPFDGIRESRYSIVKWGTDNLKVAVSTWGSGAENKAELVRSNTTSYVKLLDKSHSYSKFFTPSKAYTCRYNAAINPGDDEYDKSNLNYCIVKYSSKNAGSHSLYFWCPDFHEDGRRGEKIADIFGSTQQFVNSNIIEVTDGFRNRIIGTGSITVVSDSSAANAEICIGDIIFFRYKADAEQYLKQYSEYYQVEAPVPGPFDGIEDSQYSAVRWSEDNLVITVSAWGTDDSLKADLMSAADRSYVKMHDKEHSYTSFFVSGTAAKFRYNASINPSIDDYDESNLNYCVVNYMSKNAGAHSLYFWCPNYHSDGRRGDKIVYIPGDTGGWTNSGVITVTDGLRNRIKHNSQVVSLVSDSSSDNAEIYIGDIIFFSSKVDAEKYLVQYDRYYKTARNIPKPFDGIGVGGYSVVKFTVENIKPAQSALAEIITKDGDSYVKMTADSWKPSKFSDTGATYNKTYMFSAALNPSDSEYVEDDLVYCVVNYKAENTVPHSLYIYCPKYYDSSDTKRAEKIADVTDTESWTSSNIFEVKDGLKNRIKGTGNVIFISDSQNEASEICISSIVFFRSLSDAEVYVRQYNEYHSKK